MWDEQTCVECGDVVLSGDLVRKKCCDQYVCWECADSHVCPEIQHERKLVLSIPLRMSDPLWIN